MHGSYLDPTTLCVARQNVMPIRRRVWDSLCKMAVNVDSQAQADENREALEEQWYELTTLMKEVTNMPVHMNWSHEDFHRYQPRNFTIANDHVSKILVMLEDLRVAEKMK